jgi:hypothetical protein
MCACGSVIKHSSKKAHERSNKHRSFTYALKLLKEGS